LAISSSVPILETLQARTVPMAPKATVAIRETRTCAALSAADIDRLLGLKESAEHPFVATAA
jgi:hypothetical protein